MLSGIDETSEDAEPSVVLWVGPTDGAEFAPCFDLVSEERAVEVIDDLDGVSDSLHGETSFGLAVLACPRPLASTRLAQLLVEAVGAESVVQLLGTWCEGEGRTGQVIEGIQRVFWHHWPIWWRSRSEHESPTVEQAGAVWVRSADAELARSLVSTLQADGCGVIWAPNAGTEEPRAEVRNAEVILWDGAQLGGREATQLAAVCAEARTSRTPVVAMLDFPRAETVAAAKALGASAVLGKPFSREALLDILQHVQIEARSESSKHVNVRCSPEQACSGLSGDFHEASRVALDDAA